MELYAKYNYVKKKLFLLYALNIVDWICTLALIRTGDFYEANPVMSGLVDSLPLGFLVKCALPAVLVFVIIRLMSKLDIGGLSKVSGFTSVIIAFYLALCINHSINFVLFIFG